jgi:hypothetical protein
MAVAIRSRFTAAIETTHDLIPNWQFPVSDGNAVRVTALLTERHGKDCLMTHRRHPLNETSFDRAAATGNGPRGAFAVSLS